MKGSPQVRLTARSYWLRIALLFGIALSSTGSVSLRAVRAELVISEIMFNPDSSEGSPNDVEWVELFNTGPVAVDLTGWRLQDEDGTTGALPSGSSIASGEAVVLSSIGTSATGTVADFHAAWGTGYQAFSLDFSGMGGLANSPSATNESISLVDATMNVVDSVNFDDSSPWPTDSPDGPSIYLLASALNAIDNDLGSNWARSVEGVDGAIRNAVTARFGGLDIGSPGSVATAVPEPGSVAFLSVLAVVVTVTTRRHWSCPVAGGVKTLLSGSRLFRKPTELAVQQDTPTK